MRRLFRWFPVTWAASIYVLLLVLPSYGYVSEALGPSGSAVRTAGGETLAAGNGPGVYLIMAVPVLAFLLTVVPWPDRLRRLTDIVGAAIATAFVVLGLMSIGILFLLSAVGLIVLASIGSPPSRPAT